MDKTPYFIIEISNNKCCGRRRSSSSSEYDDSDGPPAKPFLGILNFLGKCFCYEVKPVVKKCPTRAGLGDY